MAFRRRDRSGGDDPAAVAFGASGRPLVTVTSLDGVPDEIDAQAPLDGELLGAIPGPDRPDYCLVILDRPLRFHPGPDLDLGRVLADQLTTEADGRPLVWVRTVVLVARFAGEQITPGVRDLTVDLALVVDDTTLRDDLLDFAKVLPIGVGTFGHRAAPPAPSPNPAPPSRGLSTQDVYAVFVRVAQTLRDDLETERGAPVERLDVSIDFDDRQRVDTVTGTADGLPILPGPAAFERINAAAGELVALAPPHRPARLGIHVDGTRVSFDVAYREP
jgi:hypothetical protein